ncbi:MAG: cytochrome c [Methylococcales bacterium]|nr:cytochrome c [Methylococcales bacterium]
MQFSLKPLALAFSVAMFTGSVTADVRLERSVVGNQSDDFVRATGVFNQTVAGDLYLAVGVGQSLLFFTADGQLVTSPEPIQSNQEFTGELPLLNLNVNGVPAGRYPLYQVITNPGADPLNFQNWIGGLGGLTVRNISIGLPTEVNRDFDGDGFPDDDLDHDGFHDDDRDRDGYSDDDSDRDGFHDDDRDGFDDDSDRDGFDDDRDSFDDDRDGFDDDASDRDGFDDDDDGDDDRNDDRDDDDFIPTGPINQSSAELGRELYVRSGCAASTCHDADPRRNVNDVLDGRDWRETRESIDKNEGGMGFLNFLTDAELQQIAEYLRAV